MTQKNKWPQCILFVCILMMMGSANSTVVTSIRPLGFIASAIADGVTSTEVLLPDGASPHDFVLRPSDIQKLRSAELVVWIGPELEMFLTKAITQLPANKQLAISQLDSVKPLLIREDSNSHDHDHQATPDRHIANSNNHEEHESEHHHGEYNMHLWLSPEIAKVAAIAIHDKLLELIPEKKDKLKANLSKFEKRVAQTEKNLVRMLTPVQGKGYFVFHDAYGYFEKYFGLSPLGHFTVNPEIQPGAQRLHQIKTQLLEQKVVCVFAEPHFKIAVINTVTKNTQVRSGILDPLGIGIALGAESYEKFLTALANQYVSCLE